jgi:O-antigen ligase
VLYGTVGRLVEELENPERPGGRLLVWSDAVRLFLSAPTVGTGYASFTVTFPEFRTFPAPVIYTHAESDWMQLLSDTGLVGLGLAVAACASVGLALRRRARIVSSSRASILAIGAVVALVGAAVQGIANFNLPVMSNLLYLAAAIGVALSGGGSGGIRPVRS